MTYLLWSAGAILQFRFTALHLHLILYKTNQDYFTTSCHISKQVTRVLVKVFCISYSILHVFPTSNSYSPLPFLNSFQGHHRYARWCSYFNLWASWSLFTKPGMNIRSPPESHSFSFPTSLRTCRMCNLWGRSMNSMISQNTPQIYGRSEGTCCLPLQAERMHWRSNMVLLPDYTSSHSRRRQSCYEFDLLWNETLTTDVMQTSRSNHTSKSTTTQLGIGKRLNTDRTLPSSYWNHNKCRQ
jgi:hypothetical protein